MLPFPWRRLRFYSASGNVLLHRTAPISTAGEPYFRGTNYPWFALSQCVHRAVVAGQSGAGPVATAKAANSCSENGGGVQLLFQPGSSDKAAKGSGAQSAQGFIGRQEDGASPLATGLTIYNPGVKNGSRHATNGSKSRDLKIGGNGNDGAATTHNQAKNTTVKLAAYASFVKELHVDSIFPSSSTDFECNIIAWSGFGHTVPEVLHVGLDKITASVYGSTESPPAVFLVGEVPPEAYQTSLEAVVAICTSTRVFKANSQPLSEAEMGTAWQLLNSGGLVPPGARSRHLRGSVVALDYSTGGLSIFNGVSINFVFPVRTRYLSVHAFGHSRYLSLFTSSHTSRALLDRAGARGATSPRPFTGKQRWRRGIGFWHRPLPRGSNCRGALRDVRSSGWRLCGGRQLHQVPLRVSG